MPDAALLSYLLGVASSLSGYAPMTLSELPLLRFMERPALVQEVCPDRPEECDQLVAFYDRERGHVLVSSELEMRDASDNSFLVHEFVHVLEARQVGELYQRDCEATLQSERAAYRVQNAYLEREGRSERHGGILAQRVCAADQSGVSAAMRLDMSSGGSRDEQAFERFMDELRRRDGAAARRR